MFNSNISWAAFMVKVLKNKVYYYIIIIINIKSIKMIIKSQHMLMH